MSSDNEIKLLKNNDKRSDTDIEWIDEFYRFLQGDMPESIMLGKGNKPKMSQKKAYAIIWYLQEHFPLLPDHIERCDFCGELFDSWSSGWYDEKKGKHYCSSCDIYIQDGHDIRCYKCDKCEHEQDTYTKKCKSCKSSDTLETEYH